MAKPNPAHIWINRHKKGFNVKPGGLSLHIAANAKFRQNAVKALEKHRSDIQRYVKKNTALADTAAAAVYNRVKDKRDMATAFYSFESLKGARGRFTLCGDKVGVEGEMDIS